MPQDELIRVAEKDLAKAADAVKKVGIASPDMMKSENIQKIVNTTGLHPESLRKAGARAAAFINETSHHAAKHIEGLKKEKLYDPLAAHQVPERSWLPACGVLLVVFLTCASYIGLRVRERW